MAVPFGFMLGNIGQDSDVEADYLDDEQRAALLRSNTDFLFTLPKDLRDEAMAPVDDDGPTGPVRSVDDDLVISESDISDNSLPEEVFQTSPTERPEASDDEMEKEPPPVTETDAMEIDLPILGYGENNHEIFCFSKIFTNGGLKYFFDEQRREEEQCERKIKQMTERIKRNLERQPPPLEPIDGLRAWLADPETASEDASDVSHLSEMELNHEDMSHDASLELSSEAESKHLVDRKHFLKGNQIQWEDRVATNREEGLKIWKECQMDWKSLGSMGGVTNPHILRDDWLDQIPILGESQRAPSPKLIWDLNDPNMRFRIQETTMNVDFSNAAATILPPKQKKQRVAGPAAGPEDVLKELAFFNVSKDEIYAKAVKNVVTSKNRALDGSVSLNAVPALTLSTIPIHSSDEEALEYHTRKSDFYPPENTSQGFMNKDLPENKLEIIFRSVTGRTATVGQPMEETTKLTIGDVYKHVQPKAFPEAKNEKPLFFLESPSIRRIAEDQTLHAVMEFLDMSKNIVIWIQYESIQLIRDAATELPSANSKLPVRPPGAFARRKELTALEGHVLLLEYIEEHPLLHFYPGMGMVLQTWCPLKEGRELQTIQEELERKYDATRWKYGQLKALPPDKPSPFIGPIQVRRLLSPSFAKWFQNEEFVFSVESHLMRAPAYGYATPPTDFLLVRSPSGNWSLRRTNGTISVGQQQPLVKIQPPLASTIKDFEERRLVSYACRKLSQQVRKFGNRSNHGDTVIYVEELTNRFPILSEAVIKSRLKDRCQCSSIRGEEGSFTLKAMATHLPESELRQILSPEEVCAYDSCRMFKARMSRLGLHHVDRLTQIPSDKWKLALSLLPEEMKPIAQYIQRTIQTAPWIQSEGYHSWKGGKGHVSVVGPGEPSGRGLCCSFTKEHLRKSEEGTLPIKPQPVITGTKADLRRLGAEEAITALQGLPIEMQSMIEFEDLRKMDRWEIIRHVRAIATAAVQDGIDLSPELSKFARNPRSSVQIAMGLKRKVEQAFAKQLKLLRNEEVDTKLLPIKESGPLRRDEILSKTEKRRVHRRILMEDGNQSEILLNMDVYENIAWGGTEGVLQDDNGRRIIEGRRPVATVMEEQIVERPLMLKKPVIGNRSKTIAQFGQSRIVFNKNHLKKKPKRSRTKLTAEHIWGNRYHYFERKPRSKNRRRRQEIHFPHTIASVEQEELFKALSKPKSKRALQQALVKQQQKLASGEPMEEQEDTYLMRQASLLSELGLSGSLDLGSLAMDVKTKLPYKTKDGRRMTGRKVLNTKILNKIHALAIRSQFAKYFKFQVNKRVALDYSDFVAPADEIWLDKIGSKIRGLKYSTGQMFIDDFRKLRDNAAVYNTPGNGRYGGPQVVDYAEALLRLVEEEIQKQRDLIAEEEERIKAEDTEKELKRTGSIMSSSVDEK